MHCYFSAYISAQSQHLAMRCTFCCSTCLASVMKHYVFYLQCLSRSTAVEIVNSSKVLQAETKMLLDGKLLVTFPGLDLVFMCFHGTCPLTVFSLLCRAVNMIGILHDMHPAT